MLTPIPPGHRGELSLTALLPALRRRLGLPAELHVVKAPARYWDGSGIWNGEVPGGLIDTVSNRECSGLVLLSTCHRVTEQLQHSFTAARRRGQFPATYR